MACTREREYAAALGKPILPIRVAPVSARILPPALGRVNVVDYTKPDTFETGVHLTGTVRDIAMPPPLPDPLPPEPPVPLSYLAEISELVHAANLSLRDQMAVAAMLREAVARAEDLDDAIALARTFADRDDLYARVHIQVQNLLATTDLAGPGRTQSRVTPRPFPADRAQPRRTLTGHTDLVYGVAFSPDGTLLATASADNTARVWNPATGEHIRTLTAHTDSVFGVAFSPDGTLLATASWDQTVRVWNSATGEHIRTLTDHTDGVSGVAFSPDGTLLAAAGYYKTVLVWG